MTDAVAVVVDNGLGNSFFLFEIDDMAVAEQMKPFFFVDAVSVDRVARYGSGVLVGKPYEYSIVDNSSTSSAVSQSS